MVTLTDYSVSDEINIQYRYVKTFFVASIEDLLFSNLYQLYLSVTTKNTYYCCCCLER